MMSEPCTEFNTVREEHINDPPQLPSSSSPDIGSLSKLPSPCVPYSELMRVDRPGGLYAFYLPYVFGTLYAACIAPIPPKPQTVIGLIGLLLPFTIFLRGAACSWNDNINKSSNGEAERCRDLPARGAVSTTEATVFTLCLLSACYIILLLLPPACMLHTTITVILFVIYAYVKRIAYYPQSIPGFPFAWAIFICIAALGLDPFRDHFASTLALFTANCLWTVVYDIIYAHYDVVYDEEAAVKSIVLRFKPSTKLLSGILTFCIAILLMLCGYWAGFSVMYHVGTVGGVSVAMACFIYSVDLKSHESRGAWFRDQFWTVGAGFVAGLGCEYSMKLLEG